MATKNTKAFLVRLPNDEAAKVEEWSVRLAKRYPPEKIRRRGKGGEYSPADFIRAAVREKIAHLIRSQRK